ncbi:MAG: nitrous oxide reductase accessory protein NosL [Saprospiraceae bacterium]|nr:nitrous oxide reductase accessory protein NosL [Saprospiraceae bacterium]
MNLLNKSLLFLLCLAITACSSGPEPIDFGKDACTWCKMTIMDPKFGTELVTDKGRVYKFDDINCLVEYMVENKISPQDKHSLYVLDYSDPGKIIDARTASYIHSGELRTPMASRVAAFGIGRLQQAHHELLKGEEISWDQVWKKFSVEE